MSSIWPPKKKVFTVGFITGGVTPVMVSFVWPAAQPQKKINYSRKKKYFRPRSFYKKNVSF
ncbi:DP60R [African swine fever virus]|nr:DP60R [African swine fever virus]